MILITNFMLQTLVLPFNRGQAFALDIMFQASIHCFDQHAAVVTDFYEKTVSTFSAAQRAFVYLALCLSYSSPETQAALDNHGTFLKMVILGPFSRL